MPAHVTVRISLRSVVATLAVLLALGAIAQMPTIMTQIVVALILASALRPGVQALMRRARFPRFAAVGVVFLLLFGVLGLLGALIVPTLVEQATLLASNAGHYVTRAQGTYGWLQRLDSRFHVLPELSTAVAQLSAYGAGVLKSSLGWAGQAVGGVFNTVIVFILTFFLLMDGPLIQRGALALVPPAYRGRLEAQIEPVAAKLGGYVQGVLASIGFLTAYLALGLSLLGVPLSLVLALLAGLCEIIPMVGSTLGSLPAILLALSVSWKLALAVVALFLVGNLIQNNVVNPFVFSKSVELPPVIVILALLIGGQLMGFAGALVAVPLAAAAMVLIQNLYVAPMEARAAAPDDVLVTGAVEEQ